MSPFHQQRFRIRAYETDPEGRLQAHILCKLLQEAATVHAAELGVSVESLREIGVAWVLSYLHLHVEKWPGSDAEIVVKTTVVATSAAGSATIKPPQSRTPVTRPSWTRRLRG